MIGSQMEAQQTHDILPPKLAIKAMRDSGYKDTTYAIAELVDNSIQAGEDITLQTHVEVICIDKRELLNERKVRQIDRLAVYDNACGMNARTLRLALQFGAGTRLEQEKWTGIGRFGMGLPNASISQCRRVDVWSWQNGECYHTYLDIDEIELRGISQVPEPTQKELPEDIRGLIVSPIEAHGTLVVWSKLDRVKWKRSNTFLRNSENLIGRMYRHFLNDEHAKIRLASYEDVAGNFQKDRDSFARPNDPLYLMENSSAPAPFDEEAAFDEFCEPRIIDVTYGGKKYEIQIKYSIAKQTTRGIQGGNTAIGKHAKDNIGVSVVRAGRELDIDRSFVDQSDTRERWWGVEVMFDPGLDPVFGVTNNKQAATAFGNFTIEEDAELQDMSPNEYQEQLEQEQDPRRIIYGVAGAINSTLRTIRDQIRNYAAGSRSGSKDNETPVTAAEEAATKVTNERKKNVNTTGRSDKEEQAPEEERVADLTLFGTENGLDEKTAGKQANVLVQQGIKFKFEERALSGAMIFDVISRGGVLIVQLNSKHPVAEKLYELLRQNEDPDSAEALNALRLLFMAWARMEDEASGDVHEQLQDHRYKWGKIAREFVRAIS